jgi:hypothetical protein
MYGRSTHQHVLGRTRPSYSSIPIYRFDSVPCRQTRNRTIKLRTSESPIAQSRSLSHTLILITMFSGSPFSNNRRPTLNDPRQPPYNAATTHPASIRPPSSFSPQAQGQNRVHVTLAGQGCDRERAWIDQWQTMKEHWHPAALTPGKSVGGHANAGSSQAAVGAEQTRSKL